MRQKFLLYPVLFIAALSLAFVLSTPISTNAIDEVTPTPIPQEDAQPTPVPVQPTALPTQAPQATAVPETAPESDDNAEFDVDALLEEVVEDLDAGQWRTVISKMDLVLSQEENELAYFYRAVAGGQLSRFEEAISDMDSAIELAPHQYVYYNFRGNLRIGAGDNVGALFDYDSAIRIYPLYEQAFVNRSQLNYQLGDNVAGDVDDLIARGLGRLSIGDNSGAADFLNEALVAGADEEQTAIAYYILGTTMFETQPDDAIEEFTNAMEANEDLHNSYLARGILYREGGDIVAAGQDFNTRINKLAQEFVDESTTIGDTLEVQMNYRRAFRVTFEGDAGQVVTITARDTQPTNVDPLIALLDSNGTPIAGDDDFGGNLDSQITDFELPETGTYTLLVSHAEGGYNDGFNGIVRVGIEETE